ncbi:MAG: Asp-tRNA(Asn)/Glu-tRNA(Gln) amidotransferase GatCAB subunit C [Gammaproteobacteria bacterium]|nr:Asp-tRNA(Asn)/Glu-tRNA(Gln) amidotransferase GatCAB subunit C [Gammaproteobacteria bacterium]
MGFDNSEVEKIAALAKLHLNEDEQVEVAKRIRDILSLIDEMQSVETEAIDPMAHPLDAEQRLRNDEVTEAENRDELQSLAPEVLDGFYLVPRVIE